MTLKEFISSASFAALLTAFVTIATCIISYVQGIKKVKTENFSEVYDCLQEFSQKKTESKKYLNVLITRLEEKMPVLISTSTADIEALRILYHEFHTFLGNYSDYLETLMSFYYFLYKDKPNIPATKEECWEILRLYALFTETSSAIEESCKLNYLQIITLIQFIKTNSGVASRVEIYRYFKKNGIFRNWRIRLGKALF